MMLVTVINRQNRLMWLPKVLEMNGMWVDHSTILSGALKSLAHRKDWPRSSILEGKKVNIAIRMGICSSMGRQPPIGLAPARRYSSMVFCCFLMASS